MLTAIIAFSLFGAPRPMPCPATALMQCQDTRALIANPGFPSALHDFVGEAHGAYTYGDKPLYDLVNERLSSPEDHAVAVGGNMKLFIGCKRMACPEKTALVVGTDGIKAIGIIDYGHGEPSLQVLVRHQGPGEEASEHVLRDWADAAVKHQAEHDHANTSLHEVRVRALDDQSAETPPEPKKRLVLFTLPSL